MAVKLLALDIDGTIIPPAHYGHDHIPTPRMTQAVRRVTESGILVVLASGRMFPGTAKIAHHFGLPGPVICQQGCSVHLLDGTMTHEFPIEYRLAVDIVEHAKHIGRDYEWFNPLRYIASAKTSATVEYGVVSGIEPEYRPDPENSGVVPTGVGIISTKDHANGIHRDLVARYGEALHVLDFPDVTVAVAPDANKGHSLSLLCADLGIARHDVVAIGDSVNDASMLAWAGLGLAMPHSDAYALDAADDVLDEDEDPLATYLERLVR
jgi:hydroxymethylpyrimidine pyrophosphatase-like HAD family hydrolase